ncbi:MAG: flavin reductase family protein [Deltaproteobacteria bacterium]|nr:flavin reductase family protein [Deltaproteobacteria bacterium]
MKKSIGAKTIIYPAPVLVVGSYDKNGNPNVMTAAWGGICCSDPPCVTISLRKATYTYGNIMPHKAYTISIPSREHAETADYFGIVSGRKVDKFQASGLTPEKSEYVNAPYVKEFPLILECKAIHTHEIGLHTQFIGQVMDVKADETVLNETGIPDIEKVSPVLFTPEQRHYYEIGKVIGKAFSIGKKM